MEVQHRLVLEVALQVVIDVDRAYTHRRTSEDDVARLDGEVLANEADDLVNRVNHVARITFLHRLAVYVEVEMQILHTTQRSQRHPCAHYCTSVETLAQVPWQAGRAKLVLQVACREVNTHRHLIVIAVSEALRYAAPKMIDAHHQFGLILTLLGIGRYEKRLSPRQQRRVSLGEDYWFLI